MTHGNDDLMRALISAGADMDYRRAIDSSALEDLIYDSSRRAENGIRMLIKYGANVNTRKSNFELSTPLMIVAEFGSLTTATILLLAGANPNDRCPMANDVFACATSWRKCDPSDVVGSCNPMMELILVGQVNT